MLFNLVFARNIILSGFFFFFLIRRLNFLIPAVTKQLFNTTTAELVISTVIPHKEKKAEMETHSLLEETKVSKCSI